MDRDSTGKLVQWQPKKSAMICSIHFEEAAFERDLGAELCGWRRARKLRLGALPTLYMKEMPPPSLAPSCAAVSAGKRNYYFF